MVIGEVPLATGLKSAPLSLRHLTYIQSVLTLKTLVWPLPWPQNMAGCRSFLCWPDSQAGRFPVAASLREAGPSQVACPGPTGPPEPGPGRGGLGEGSWWMPCGSPTEGLPLPSLPGTGSSHGLRRAPAELGFPGLARGSVFADCSQPN